MNPTQPAGVRRTRTARGRALASGTAICGAFAFLIAVVLHPRRDGVHIAEVGQWYGLIHGVEAVALVLQAIGLVGLFWPHAARLRPLDTMAVFAALLGTIWYFGLIVVDGTRNPVTARYAPQLVHTPADLDAGTAIIVLPALLLFPLGYVLLGLLHTRYHARTAGLLLAGGAVLYTVGGLAIFGLGPSSPAIEVLEILGAVPYALGFALMARTWAGGAPPLASAARPVGAV